MPTIVVRKSIPSKYDLIVGNNGDEFVIKDIIKVFAAKEKIVVKKFVRFKVGEGV